MSSVDLQMARLRSQMVDEQLKRRGISDPGVLSAIEKLPRHCFVPVESTEFAYSDGPLGIGYQQTISQPYMVAFMTQVLKIGRQDRVLEIGTGCGYQTAVLAELAKEVYTIEIVKFLAAEAKKTLTRFGYSNIHFKIGDGHQGWKEYAPYDAMIVTAAPQEVPARLLEQLNVGGRMVVPIGMERQDLYLITKTLKDVRHQHLLAVRFVPMVAGDP